ncbi:MAG: hypothetical protein RLZZ511_3717 [Cyanobacteriota bacterium]|jgi:hypothetical protein
MFDKIPLIGKIPFAILLLAGGGILTVVGTVAYIMNYAALNMAGFFYGIPMFLGGIAFKITELKPVPITQPLTAAVETLRDTQATATQKEIFKDVTRYRYGERAHLAAALKFLGLSPTDEERPELIGLYETAIDQAYALVLGFDSPMISFQTWQNKQDKMEQFFGPGVRVTLEQPEEDVVKVAIIATPEAAVKAAV